MIVEGKDEGIILRYYKSGVQAKVDMVILDARTGYAIIAIVTDSYIRSCNQDILHIVRNHKPIVIQV